MMLSSPLISVIIPHYNTPDLLMRCLASIPVRPDIEVIVIDDCSPDAARYVADYPALSRPNLTYLSTTQGGSASRARNVGLDHARGEWICFVDADDYVEEGYFPTSMPADCDMVIENWSFFGGGSALDEHLADLTVCGEAETAAFFERYGAMDILHIICSKFIRRQIVEQLHLRFDPRIRYGEDVVFYLGYYAYCQGIKVLDGARYMYYKPADWDNKYRLPLTDMLYYLDAIWRRYRCLPFEMRSLVASILQYAYVSTRDAHLRRTRLRFLMQPSVFRLYRSISRRRGLMFVLSYVRGLLVNLCGL